MRGSPEPSGHLYTYDINIERKVKKPDRPAESWPYCNGKDFVKRGIRKNKYQDVQLYLCRDCEKTGCLLRVATKQYYLQTVTEEYISQHLIRQMRESHGRGLDLQ